MVPNGAAVSTITAAEEYNKGIDDKQAMEVLLNGTQVMKTIDS